MAEELTLKDYLLEQVKYTSDLANALAQLMVQHKFLAGTLNEAVCKQIESKHWILETLQLMNTIEQDQKEKEEKGSISTAN